MEAMLALGRRPNPLAAVFAEPGLMRLAEPQPPK
jgi:hypothetical protein